MASANFVFGSFSKDRLLNGVLFAAGDKLWVPKDFANQHSDFTAANAPAGDYATDDPSFNPYNNKHRNGSRTGASGAGVSK